MLSPRAASFDGGNNGIAAGSMGGLMEHAMPGSTTTGFCRAVTNRKHISPVQSSEKGGDPGRTMRGEVAADRGEEAAPIRIQADPGCPTKE